MPAKPVTVRRQVVRLEVDGARLEDEGDDDAETPRELSEREKWLLAFWSDLVATLRFDDPS